MSEHGRNLADIHQRLAALETEVQHIIERLDEAIAWQNRARGAIAVVMWLSGIALAASHAIRSWLRG